MEPITRGDKHERNNMMTNQLPEILPRLLESQANYNALLRPVRCLEQVISLEFPADGFMRKVRVHPGYVEIPDGCAPHD